MWHNLKLVRPDNLLIIVLSQTFAAFFLFPSVADVPKLMFCMLSCLCIAAAGYVINDYFDVKIDTINRPKTVVVDVHLSRRKALLLYLVLTSIGLVAALLTFRWAIVGLALFNTWLLWYYSYHLKRTVLWGNLAIAWLTASLLLLLVPLAPEAVYRLAIFALFAFYITLIREMIKDMEDVKGDKMFGCLTFPIKYGYRNTKRLIFLLTGLFAFSATLVAVHISVVYMVAFGLIGCLCLLLLYQLYFADTRKKLSRLSQLAKLIMLLGVGSMALSAF